MNILADDYPLTSADFVRKTTDKLRTRAAQLRRVVCSHRAQFLFLLCARFV